MIQTISASVLAAIWLGAAVALYVAGSRGGRNPSSPSPLSPLALFSIIGHLFGLRQLKRNEVAVAGGYWVAGIAALVIAPIPWWCGVLGVFVMVWTCYATLPPALSIPGFLLRIHELLGGGMEGFRRREETKRAAEKAKRNQQREKQRKRKDAYRRRQRESAEQENRRVRETKKKRG